MKIFKRPLPLLAFSSVAALGVLWLVGFFGLEPSRCSDEPRFVFRHEIDFTQPDPDRMNVEVYLTSLQAPGAQAIRPLIFIDGHQQAVDETPIVLECGQSDSRVYALEDLGEGAVLNVLYHLLPSIPEAIASSDLSNPLSSEDVLDAAYDFVDRDTVVFGETRTLDAPPDEPAAVDYLGNISLKDGYLYSGNTHESPQHVAYLSETDVYDFGVYFSDATDEPSGIYTVTCLLDDRQIEAFEGRPAWSGPIKDGEAVLLRGRVTLEPGWHQLMCVVLNSVYGEAGGESRRPYIIRSTFLHLKE